MDFELDRNIKDEFLENDNEKVRSLGPREKNEITAELIKKQIGDIEQIRASFGLNKKRMCELLLIDPSTWTRWTTGKTSPPPSVYRTLQWGLAVMEKHPEFHPLLIRQNYSKSSNSIDSDKEIQRMSVEISKIQKDLQKWIYIAGFSFLISFMLLGAFLI